MLHTLHMHISMGAALALFLLLVTKIFQPAYKCNPKRRAVKGRAALLLLLSWLRSPLLGGEGWIGTDLPKPRALEKEGAGPEGLQDDVVSEEHLEEGAEGSSKDSHGQQGMEVVVQRTVAVVKETEEQTCQDSHCVRKGCSAICCFD